ncbi:uncharacterized protein I206_107501 [Kwoniella pini CBS 10737]|uniref:DH domain-containing protein n=1 Tax=Kwoniella pini CBS 10737 TaxID=1296096 RepID=A0A1B9HXG0_9TREE|nr:uncharacterized protein I206_05829 [Kwoniella pini CBS 10737]OCF47963.1 hypothetical protein I206_05829 [Kwoniella pini CBS 10737]
MRLIKRRSSQNLSSTAPIAQSIPPIPDPQLGANDVGPTIPFPTKDGKGTKRRDSKEMKYPPTSFGQSGAGWSFGRMRSFKNRSRSNSDAGNSGSEEESQIKRKGKGKETAKQPLVEEKTANTTENPLNFDFDYARHSSSPSLPPPQMVFPDIDTPDFTTSPPQSPFLPAQPAYPQPSQPIMAFGSTEHHQTSVTALAGAQSESLFSTVEGRPSLNTALSASSTSIAPSIISGESSYPLISRSDSGQRSQQVISISPAHRKLTKRRPGSMAQYDQVELVERPSTSSSRSAFQSRPYTNPSPTQIYAVLTGPVVIPRSFSSNLPLPDGAAPPTHQLNWPLNRNPSCSTNASSGMTPSTEESGMLETPNNAIILPGQGEDRLWERIGEPRPPLSRTSTFSYREGDDGTVIKQDGYFHDKTSRERSSTSQSTDSGIDHTKSNASEASLTFHTDYSRATYTPTVSSGSDVTAIAPRNLRISTSNLELRSHQKNQIVSPSTPTRKKSVAFEVQSSTPKQVIQDPQHVLFRTVRPPLIRLRSSSVGAMSVNTNSVYSVGEVQVASSAVISKAEAVVLADVARSPVIEMLDRFENSSEAVRRAFDNERERGDWPLPALDYSSQDIHNARSAPPQPHSQSPHKLNGISPLSPILRSASTTASPKKLVSFHSAGTEPAADQGITQMSLKRPTMPARSSSLSKLWHRLSTNGSGSKPKKGKSFEDPDEDIPPVPRIENNVALTEYPAKLTSNSLERIMSTRIKRSRGSLDLTSVGKENPDFVSLPTKFSLPKDTDRPSTPSSTSSRRSKGKKRISISSIPPPRAHSVPLPPRSDTPPVIPPLSPTPPLRDPVPSDTALPLDYSNSVPAVGSDVSPLKDAPTRSFRKISSPEGNNNWKTPLGPYTPPLSAIVNDYFRDLKTSSSTSTGYTSELFTREITLHRTSLHEDAEYQSYDAKRRYRQSLVEIKDDEAFHATVEQLVKLESDDRVRMTRAGGAALRGDMPPIYRTPSKDLSEKQIRQENIRAWFVTRELVQGERRHGRLLAKGVAAIQLAVKSRTAIPPVPPIPVSEITLSQASSTSKTVHTPCHSRSGSGNIKISSRLRRSRTSTPGPSSASSPTTPVLPSISLPLSASAPLDILLEKLPRLYELSIELSERFEHDPSPYGVADAFLSMEENITKEISNWAKGVGEIVYSGIGDEMNKILDQQRGSGNGRRRSEGGMYENGGESEIDSEIEGSEGRVRFADIIIVPIQRASRYRLLFQELSTKLPPLSHTSLKIQRALEASTRLAMECDRCQSFDLNALRRQVKKGGRKIRPVSVGPGIGSLL